jgi:pyridoxine 5-phosphate synthase
MWRRFARRGIHHNLIRATSPAELAASPIPCALLMKPSSGEQMESLSTFEKTVDISKTEMAATDEMIEIARKIGPHTSMLVPEGRQEVTTEGGLDVASQPERMRDVVARLKDKGMIVSAFIDPDLAQVQACADVGFDVCEVHTGPYAHAFGVCGGDLRKPELQSELSAVTKAGEAIREQGMRFNAGHALNYHNVHLIAALDGIDELHIGHSIVCRAVYTGLRSAVAEMKSIMMSSQ